MCETLSKMYMQDLGKIDEIVFEIVGDVLFGDYCKSLGALLFTAARVCGGYCMIVGEFRSDG